ncbi:hypothetical protein HN51_060889 [Arachis hypogaea]|uniref:Transcription repressor n=1 Tax=Arachis hypogaea TaxID=3818 RepID=A0A444XB84_ARAHY|nr:transcription repressor OFP5-like [Arachis ipaensis]XP_029147138.1 transcription repressor OFP5-like [Arachis hypogaea]QHO04405.1 Transcription repressor [Arachis hypogaea]RYQ86966.1 hypothetical protein Ahy_B10g106572 [Arachis hypogaea]
MKWGGRKSSPASSSNSINNNTKHSFISQVSPFSWLSKFKQMRINSERKPGQNAKQNSVPSYGSAPKDACGNRGRFYGGEDDAFWRLSFGEESHEHNKSSEDILKSTLHNLDGDHANDVIQSSAQFGPSDKRHGRRDASLRFKQKDIGMGEERKLPSENECDHGGKEFEFLRRRYERKAQKVFQDQLLKLEKAADNLESEFASSNSKSLENDVLKSESPRTIRTPRTNSYMSSVNSKNSGHGNIKEGGVNSGKNTEELRVKVNKKRQSLHVSKELQRRKPRNSPRVRVHSPRMASKVEICKIKAIEDMKKAKLKMKKEEEISEETAGVDSFAVVKCSMDPQQDFRDSMMEMIVQRKISRPEEMEELLACYLTLNSSEYHDIIIKVFREVWLYVNKVCCLKSEAMQLQ